MTALLVAAATYAGRPRAEVPLQGDHSGQKNLPLNSVWDVPSSIFGSR